MAAEPEPEPEQSSSEPLVPKPPAAAKSENGAAKPGPVAATAGAVVDDPDDDVGKHADGGDGGGADAAAGDANGEQAPLVQQAQQPVPTPAPKAVTKQHSADRGHLSAEVYAMLNEAATQWKTALSKMEIVALYDLFQDWAGGDEDINLEEMVVLLDKLIKDAFDKYLLRGIYLSQKSIKFPLFCCPICVHV